MEDRLKGPDGRALAVLAARAADEKKASRITLIGLQDVSLMADYFVICSGQNPVQVRAIAQNVAEKLEEQGIAVAHEEGMAHGRWVLLDCGLVVVHVMLEREREFYNLERLWGQGQVEEFAQGGPELSRATGS